MDVVSTTRGNSPDRAALVRTFLIADIRGYSTFTRERGDEDAARLAARFADLARDAVEARGGRVIELRGDEALAVFGQPAQAVRAALEFQEACREATQQDPRLPLPVGVGIDQGEAIPVEDGYRGAALNMAARLCSKAVAGQVLATTGIRAAAEGADDLVFQSVGSAELKGFDRAVELWEAHPKVAAAVVGGRVPSEPLPPELDDPVPLAGREHELRWLRGTWRQARRGHGRVVFVSGPAGIGKTRLAAELAAHVQTTGGSVRYLGSGGAGGAEALAAVAQARSATAPTLYVLDDVSLYPEVVAALAASVEGVESRPVLVLGLFRTAEGQRDLSELVERVDARGDGHRPLDPLALDGVAEIAQSYLGDLDRFLEFPAESILRASGGVPARMHEVVSEWAGDEAKRRLAAAAEWLAAGKTKQSAELDFANNVITLNLGRIYAAPSADRLADSCPYKGLAAFQASDAAYFYGRERLVGELAARMVGMGLLGVVGPSGSGKSSVVMAGLLPSLAAGLLPGSERWGHAVLRPGEHPMEGLETTLASCDRGERLVLVLDQFEEVFTATVEEAERAAFIDRLVRLAGQPERSVVVTTIRGDYTDHLTPYPEFAELVASNLVLIGPMAPEELRRAIELPARRVGLRVESSLVDALVEEVADEPGALPLLSTALVELWLAREDGWLRMHTYERTGGVRGAVARLAETSFGQLGGEQREAARAVLLRLVGEGEGEAGVRRRVARGEFDPTTAVQVVLERFTRDRLFTVTDGTVEVAHEALIREWPRLRNWIEEDRAGLLLRRRITEAAQEWERVDRDESLLFRGLRLAEAEEWGSRHAKELNPLERQFVAESKAAAGREAERLRKTNRRLRGLLAGVAAFLVVALVAGSLALVQRGRAERQRKQAQSRELAASAISELPVDPELSLLLSREAAREAPTAEAVNALRQSLIESQVRVGFRGHTGPINAAKFSPDAKLVVTASEDKTARVWDAATGKTVAVLRGHTGPVETAEFSPDGKLVVTASDDGTARVWEAATGRKLAVLAHPRKPHGFPATGVRTAQFSSDGKLVLTAFDDGARIWNWTTAQVATFMPSELGSLRTARYSPDGKLVATAGPELLIWNAGTGKLVARGERRQDKETSYFGVEFSEDSRRVVTTGESGTQLFSVKTGKILAVLSSFGFSAEFSPNGNLVVTAPSEDGNTATVWDVRTRRSQAVLRGHTATPSWAKFSPDGKLVVTASDDGTARVWVASTGQSLAVLRGHIGALSSVEFSPDGKSVLTAGIDGTARRWQTTAGTTKVVFSGQLGTWPWPSVQFSPDGRLVLVAPGSDPTTATVWDASTGRPVGVLKGHAAPVQSAEFSSDGKLVLTAAGDGARVWDAATGRPVAVIHVELSSVGPFPAVARFSPDSKRILIVGTGAAEVWEVEGGRRVWRFPQRQQQPEELALEAVFVARFSPDGRYVATGGVDSTPRVWEAATGKSVAVLGKKGPEVSDVQFTRDGRYLVTGTGFGANVWDLTMKRSIASVGESVATAAGTVFKLTPDGEFMVTAGSGGAPRVWETTTGKQVAVLGGEAGEVRSAEFSPNGKFVVTASADGAARVWDSRTGQLIDVFSGHFGPVTSAAFSPNGRLVVTASEDGAARIFACELCGALDDLMALGNERITRELTTEERVRFLHESKA